MSGDIESSGSALAQVPKGSRWDITVPFRVALYWEIHLAKEREKALS